MTWKIDSTVYEDKLGQTLLYTKAGKITKSIGLVYEAHLPGASVGSLCRILSSHEPDSEQGFDAEVIGFRDKRILLMPYEDAPGVSNSEK